MRAKSKHGGGAGATLADCRPPRAMTLTPIRRAGPSTVLRMVPLPTAFGRGRNWFGRISTSSRPPETTPE